MKKFILILALAVFNFTIYAQVPTAKDNELSNVEKFSDRAGILLKKEFTDVGVIKKCKIQTAHFEDLIGGQKTSGIRFEYEYKGSYSSDTKLALLDEDEIDGLIKSIKIIQEKVFTQTPTNYTEVSFRSRSGFEAGCFFSKGSWSTYIKLERFDGNSFVFMDKEELAELLSLLSTAKTKL